MYGSHVFLGKFLPGAVKQNETRRKNFFSHAQVVQHVTANINGPEAEDWLFHGRFFADAINVRLLWTHSACALLQT